MINLKNFFGRKDGLVTLEWVGIAAVVLIAGLAITFLVMEGADSTGQSLNTAQGKVGTAATTTAAPDMTKLGDGQNSKAASN